MKKWIGRLFYGLAFAIPLMMVTYAFGEAATPPQRQPAQAHQEGNLECSVCHSAFQEAWENSAHGQATTDPVFTEAWDAQGQPGECLQCHATGYDPRTRTWEADGITCEACHSPITANHPLAPMSADRSAQMCGDCHAETYFEWQISAHREEGLDCVGCHDPHKTGVKTENTSLLCASCHRERASNFAHSAHSQEGLECADCHLGVLTEQASQGHGKQDHSFYVSLATCNECHAYQMHDPVAVHPEHEEPAPPTDAMAAVQSVEVTSEPEPVNPLGFTVVVGLIGVALGAILAPWLERFGHRATWVKGS